MVSTEEIGARAYEMLSASMAGSITGVVDWERTDYTKEDIDRIYRYKESLPENHQFIKENHKETLAQVFTEVRYKKSDNECMSVTLKETLKKQGFEK